MVEIETAKAAVELPSPFAGRVHALLVEPGVTVEVGTPIITVDTDPAAGTIEETQQPDRSAAGDPAGGSGQTNGTAPRSARWPPTAGSPPWSATRPAAAATPAGSGGPGDRDRIRPPRPIHRHHRRPDGRRRSRSTGQAPLATPPVRKLAKDLGIDLGSVPASRPDGVISRADIESAAAAAHLDGSRERPA